MNVLRAALRFTFGMLEFPPCRREKSAGTRITEIADAI